MEKIVFNQNSDQSKNADDISSIAPSVKSNISMVNMENVKPNAEFPDWDIIPQNQFINPRIKHNK